MGIKNGNAFTEEEFLKQYKSSDYETLSVTTDMLLFTIEHIKNPVLKILLIKREDHPYKDGWALPGGFVKMDESIHDAARRILKEKTGLEGIYLEQLYTFGEPLRDPRMRVITTAYFALLPEGSIKIRTDDYVDKSKWFRVEIHGSDEKKQLMISDDEIDIQMKYNVTERMERNGVINMQKTNVWLDETSKSRLAFDHADIIFMAICRMIGKCEYVPILFNLMPKNFTIPKLQAVYTLFLGKKLHKTHFRNKISAFIEETGDVDKSTRRPSKLYRYKN